MGGVTGGGGGTKDGYGGCPHRRGVPPGANHLLVMVASLIEDEPHENDPSLAAIPRLGRP